MTSMSGSDPVNNDCTDIIILGEKEAWNRYYDNEIEKLKKELRETVKYYGEVSGKKILKDMKLVNEKRRLYLQFITAESSSVVHMSSNGNGRGSSSWRCLPPETIQHIMSYFILPLHRNSYELYYLTEINQEVQEHTTLIKQWIIRQLFGYFQNFSCRQVILQPLFPCISLPRDKATLSAKTISTLVNILVRMKTIFYLDIRGWLKHGLYFNLSSTVAPDNYYSNPSRQKKYRKVGAVSHSFIVHNANKRYYFDILSHQTTADLYAMFHERFSKEIQQRYFTLLWKNDHSILHCSPTITIQQAREQHGNDELNSLIMEFDGDLSFDHIKQLHLSDWSFDVLEDVGEWASCKEFLSRCTNLIELSGTHAGNLNRFGSMRRLTLVRSFGNNNSWTNLPSSLTEFHCADIVPNNDYDQLPMLPNLKKLSISTLFPKNLVINTNLTYLNLEAYGLDSQSVISILNYKNLKELSLRYGAADNIAFPYFVSNTSITNLSIGVREIEFKNLGPELVQYVAQNRTIRHLTLLKMESTELSIDQMWPQLLSFSGWDISYDQVKIMLSMAHNLTSLELNNSWRKLLSMDRILLELPQLTQFKFHGTCETKGIEHAFMNTKVKHLDLSGCPNCSQFIMYLRGNNNLRTLVLTTYPVQDEVVISLLNMKSLLTLKVKCDGMDCGVIIPHIKQNENLESLELYSLKIATMSCYKRLYEAASHIPHFVASNN